MQLWVGNGCDAAVRVGHTVNTNNECLYQDFILHNEAHNQGLVGRHKLLQGLQAAICRNLNDFVVQSQQTEVALHSAHAHTTASDIWPKSIRYLVHETHSHRIIRCTPGDIWCTLHSATRYMVPCWGISGDHASVV